jgi:TH1 protein
VILETMITRLENPTRSDIDASLIRYFVFGIVDVVQGPVSPVMVRLLTKLLSVTKVSDALRSSYVSKENTQRLRSLISLFPATIKRCGGNAIFADDKQFSNLAKLYGISE